MQRAGYLVEIGLTRAPQENDLLVSWNRIGAADNVARMFRRSIIVENASWGNGFQCGNWLHMARTYHNTAGMFPVGDNHRWDTLGVELQPFRTGGETVILAQRGIGSSPTVMPTHWPGDAKRRHGGRIRLHPGKRPAPCLHEDLARCGRVVTWGSGAAIQALMMGIPVTSEMPNWIGEQDNTQAGRLAMFQRLAWAQWRTSEIETGEPFVMLLEHQI